MWPVEQISSDAFDRLNQASVAMLEPLYEPSLQDAPQQLAARLATAIGHCARTAESLGLRSLNYLSTLVVPYLHGQARGGDWAQARERIEGWIGDVIAFCAGQLPAAEVGQLVLAPLRWREFPIVPEQFVALITGRLRHDEQMIAAAATGDYPWSMPIPEGTPADAEASQPAPEPSEMTPEPAIAEEQSGRTSVRRRPSLSGQASRAARDEFLMLAEAAEALADELGGADALQHAQDLLGNLAGATEFIGVEALAAAIGVARDALDAWAAHPAPADERAAAEIREFARHLSAYLRSPSSESAHALCALLASPDWPVGLAPEAVDELAQALASVELAASRQVAAPVAEIDEDDLSLEIPADTDMSTVDNLLRELPALSAQFSEDIERGLQGARDRLLQAQRIAHTLKGAANTVGVRGVATLTHRLEDLLQLLARDEAPIPEGLAEQLAAAADCLGEMTDAVAGVGEPPQDSRDVCNGLAAWIARLLSPDQEQALEPPAAGEGERSAAPAAESVVLAAAPPAPAATEVEAAEAATEAVADEEARDRAAMLRVPATLVDRMLELAGEASMLLAQAQEQLAQVGETRSTFRLGAERMQDLAAELERLVDVRGVSLGGRGRNAEFDALELDEFNELHTVSRRIAEAGADGHLLGRQLDRQVGALTEVAGQLERVQTELRDAVMRTRTVPVSSIAARLGRALRQAARMAAKQASLSLDGEAIGVDAQLLQTLIDPLAHLLRNAVDHGVESPQERAALGKPPEGRIRLAFNRVGRSLRISCRDDGRGLDTEAIRARAVELGLVAEHEPLRESDLARAIMHPGFTTRRSATQLSGRGIGLDIVRQAVAALRGTIDVRSFPGAGTEIVIEVPEPMASQPVAVARSPSLALALSIRGVEQLVSPEGLIRDEAGVLRFPYGDGFIAAEHLDERLGLSAGYFERELAARASAQPAGASPGSEQRSVAAIVTRDDGEKVALITPELGQTRSVVVRPLPGWMPRIDAIEGATVLGDGAVAPVIDLPTLLSRPRDAHRPAPLAAAESRSLPLCLVVDDSVSVRRAMEAFMRDLGFAVEEAADGVEALALVERRVPDLAIIDLEMPRMNGIELAATLRSHERTHGIGLIMITSRYSEKHRAMALDAGIDVFMTKPYTEDELAASVAHCMSARSG